ncbi:hypothetical protein BV898_02615 [Hypsibius exemplaris]|uniref:Uncharacterized protein n=1 Tax=Hypsibius exemplaris TaxID=2072580 RepID=A0A1W0X7I8_HYPEX|nr:hypothetical protein BV898_02615 [Hypsibius exemplaris]
MDPENPGRPLFGLQPIHDANVYGIMRTKVNKLGFRTTSNDYGKYPPTKAMLPTSSHPRNNEFAANHIRKPEDGRMNI